MNNRRIVEIGLVISIACIIACVVLLNQSTPVNGTDIVQTSDTNTIRVYLGQAIHEYNKQVTTTGSVFYYHGVMEYKHITSSYASDYIIIGHCVEGYREAGMSNIYIRAEKGMTFRIDDKTFKLVDYAKDWIELE